MENTGVGMNVEYGFVVMGVENEGDSSLSRGAGEVLIDGAVEFGGVRDPIEDGENIPELNINAGGEAEAKKRCIIINSIHQLLLTIRGGGYSKERTGPLVLLSSGNSTSIKNLWSYFTIYIKKGL